MPWWILQTVQKRAKTSQTTVRRGTAASPAVMHVRMMAMTSLRGAVEEEEGNGVRVDKVGRVGKRLEGGGGRDG